MEDEGFYKEMLSDFAASYEKRMGEINDALEKDDIKLYRTLVHSLKSASRSVGADDVSELAQALENAAGEENTEFVRTHNSELEKLFRTRAEQIKEII